MASIFKPTYIDPKTGERKKAKTWRICYRDEQGVRRSVGGFRDKEATQAKARELERNAERSRAGLPVAQRKKVAQPLAQVCLEYLADLLRRGSKAKDKHYQESKRILDAIIKSTNWQSLSAIRADAFVKHLTTMAQAGRAPRTQNRHLETLRAFLNWCVMMGWLEGSPIERLKPVEVGQAGKRRRRRAFTVEEWRALCEADSRRGIIYAVAGLSGLRRSELARLEKRDLQPMKWTLRGEITKNGRTENLPMLPECWAKIEARWNSLKNAQDKVFKNLPCAETVRKDLETAGITRQDQEGRWVDFHSLRYFFCTILARKLPIQVVKSLMRHGDIRLTCNLYMDLGLDDLNESVLALPTIIPPTNHGDKNQNAKKTAKGI